MMKDLLRTADLGLADVDLLLRLARGFANDPWRDGDLLCEAAIALSFTPTEIYHRVPAEAAVARLGGHPVLLDREELRPYRGETPADTARLLSCAVAALVVGAKDRAELTAFAEAATVPVVGAMASGDAPLRALTDLFTLTEALGPLTGRRVAYLGEGADAASLATVGVLAGATVVLACPPGHEPDREFHEELDKIAAVTGGSLHVLTDPVAAALAASVVATGRHPDFPEFEPYRVDADLMRCAGLDAVFLHPMPARRGREVTAEVLDSQRSLVLAHAANRQAVTQAVLYALLTHRLRGPEGQW
ncbi:ornithine carbamoyltransferase [Crossiella equi]|uniref:Ornithine carbamoyltransferase n=3 Tax=Crossiella equi TaxID=130796 RepID=A0ABS5ASI2_9PSEU|nr:ornithine carbamoyltransferase [Crossiella equi]